MRAVTLARHLVSARRMSSYVIPPPPQASLAVQGTDSRFPVRRIFCVGRNYWDHGVFSSFLTLLTLVDAMRH